MIIKTSIPGLADSLVIPLQNKVNELNKEIIDINKTHEQEVFELNKNHTEQIDNLNSEINSKDLLISDQQTEITNQNEQINGLSQEIEQLNITIDDLNNQLSEVQVPKGTKYTYSSFTKLPSQFKSQIEQEEDLFETLAFTNLTGELELNLYNATDATYMLANGSAGAYFDHNFDYINKLTKVDITFHKPCICAGLFDGCRRNLESVSLNGTLIDIRSMFKECTKLSKILGDVKLETTNYKDLFYGCESLTEVPYWVDLSKATDTMYMFYRCKNLIQKEWVICNSALVDVEYMFYNSKIESVDLLECPNVKTIFSMVAETKIKSLKLDVKNCTSSITPFGSYGTSDAYLFRDLLIKNLGFQESSTYSYLQGFNNLGINNDEFPNARKNLIDTLITYSFDRANAGYSTHTIRISAPTYNPIDRLTEDEIAQITAKGYTLI